MKKIYLLLSFLALTVFTFAQPVSRNYVLLEIGTGCWCYYCPGAAMGADDLIANGDPAAVIENHNGDPFATSDSDARNSYYGITGYPTAWFDGSYDEVIGGSNTESMYDTYEPIVSARILMDSDFTLDIFGTNDGDDYDITLRVQNVNGYTGDNLALRFALTESEIEYTWQGMSEVNFVNRLMVPDHNGTDIGDMDLSDLTDIPISFTFDNTWDDAHCELVAFIQDDDTKEVLQSQKVELNSLVPPLLAAFSASASITCSSSVIDFTDESLGTGINTWDWTFEGGTPATSTDQNPSVTYNTPGVYWVELTVTDDVGSSTVRVEDCITVLETPAQADTPDGEAIVCTDQSYLYSISEVPYTQVYEWEISPTDAGTLTVNENEATLLAADDWTGDFSIRVRATNICGDGDWSDELEATSFQSPLEYTLEGGGSYCFEGDGSEVTLSGSDNGVDYELFLDGESTGVVIEGTGSELSFGYQTDEGFYTAVASNDNCELDMVNQIQVSVMYAPDAPETPTGSTALCNDETTDYETAGVDGADSYEWVIYPEEAGTLNPNDMQASVEWNPDFAGEVQLAVYGVNDCGMGTSSEELIIDVDDVPEPVIDGLSLVCDFTEEVYTVTETEGNTYTWAVTGGTITEGQGTSSISVEWGEVGSGTVNLEEETPNSCYGVATEFPVTIDECAGIGENETAQISLYPNPANDYVNITSNQQIITLTVFNYIGKLVEQKEVNRESAILQTTSYEPGMYIVKITTPDGVSSRRLIIE
jgi:PKD repeat protein